MLRTEAAEALLDHIAKVHLLLPRHMKSAKVWVALRGGTAFVRAVAAPELPKGATAGEFRACMAWMLEAMPALGQQTPGPAGDMFTWGKRFVDLASQVEDAIRHESRDPAAAAPAQTPGPSTVEPQAPPDPAPQGAARRY